MDSWVVRPEQDRLPLADDQWVLVRRRLNAGEYRAHLKRSSTLDDAGDRRIDALEHGLSTVVSYLIGWSNPIALQDENGAPLDPETLVPIVNSLSPERFNDIKQAIEAHVAKQEAARAAEKKTDGTTTSAPTSSSPDTSAGRSTGSPSSTPTSTT